MAFVVPLAASLFTATASTAAAATTTAAVAGTAAEAGLAGISAAELATFGSATLAAGETAAAATAPAWLTYAGIGSTLLGGGISAYGQIMQGEAQAKAAKYNKEVAQGNADAAQRNAELSAASADALTGNQGLRNRATMGSIIANQAASGIDVMSGSAIDVRSSAAELGELNSLTVRANATKEAYGYQVQKSQFDQQATLEGYAGKNASDASEIGAASTLLGSAGSAAANFYNYQLHAGNGFTTG